jgi:hypothetical protein
MVLREIVYCSVDGFVSGISNQRVKAASRPTAAMLRNTPVRPKLTATRPKSVVLSEAPIPDTVPTMPWARLKRPVPLVNDQWREHSHHGSTDAVEQLKNNEPRRIDQRCEALDWPWRGRDRRVEARRKAFIRKWRLKHRAVADSLEEAGDRLFTFTRLPPSQWRSARTTNAIERLHEEFKRRIKTQTVLPSAETAAMLLGAARFRSDQHAQSRWLADARHKAN